MSRARRPGHLRVVRYGLAAVLAAGALLVWSCRDRKGGNARADDGPGALSGKLFIICTGDTYAALENCH